MKVQKVQVREKVQKVQGVRVKVQGVRVKVQKVWGVKARRCRG